MVRKAQNGTIIIFSVVIIGIIGLLYASIFILIGTERKIFQSLENRTKAYYIAESGLERAIALIKQDSDTLSFTIENPFDQYTVEHKIIVTISQPEPDPAVYYIESLGIYNNTKRKLAATVYRSIDSFAVQSRKEIN